MSQNRGDEPPGIPEAAIAGVRETMGRMVSSYLDRRGKRRYCDKSLGTARFAELVTRIWPEARFICLFRHPMDVIASGMEACPWGLNGYGFDQYIAETPGNAVLALSRFWADNAAAILSAEERDADRCCRVRYEDLVADTQGVSDRIFDFLGVDRVPDIEKRVFAPERERFGPADYKIWHTSQVSTDSVGRGWAMPAGMISPPVREVINQLCGKLDYVPVDDGWGTTHRPADLRLAPVDEATGATGTPMTDASVPEPVFPPALGKRLAAGLALIGEDFVHRWHPCAEESFELVVTPATFGKNTRCLIDLSTRTMTHGSDAPSRASINTSDAPEGDEDLGGKWELIASAETWERVHVFDRYQYLLISS